MALTKEKTDRKRVELYKATSDLSEDEAKKIMARWAKHPERLAAEIRDEVLKGKPSSKHAPWSISRPNHRHRFLNAYVRLFCSWRLVGWFCPTEYGFKGRRGYSHGLPEIVARHWKPRGKGPIHPCPKNGGRDTRMLFLYCERGSPSAYERGQGSKPRFEAIGYWCPSCGAKPPG
jgi:hypothetical protein